MVVDDAARLHRRVDGRRADEAEAGASAAPSRAPSTPAWSPASRCDAARRGGRAAGDDQTSSCSGVPASRSASVAARVRDRRLDLAAVADDAGVAEQPLDVALAEARDRARDRSRRTRRGSSRACAGSSATRAPTGSPRGRAARRGRARRDRPAPLLVVVGECRARRSSPSSAAAQTIDTTSRPRRRPGYVSTGSYRRQRQRAAGRELERCAVARADDDARSSSQSPSQSGPSSCEQRSSIA